MQACSHGAASAGALWGWHHPCPSQDGRGTSRWVHFMMFAWVFFIICINFTHTFVSIIICFGMVCPMIKLFGMVFCMSQNSMNGDLALAKYFLVQCSSPSLKVFRMPFLIICKAMLTSACSQANLHHQGRQFQRRVSMHQAGCSCACQLSDTAVAQNHMTVTLSERCI